MMTLLMKTSDFKLERRLCGRKVPFCLLPSVLATNRCEWFSHLGPQNGNAHVNLGQISVSHIRCHIGESRIILKTFPSNYGFEDWLMIRSVCHNNVLLNCNHKYCTNLIRHITKTSYVWYLTNIQFYLFTLL